MSDFRRSPISVELDAVYREEYLHAVEAARALHDPHADWDGFVEELWERVVPAFGLDVEVVAPGSGFDAGPAAPHE